MFERTSKRKGNALWFSNFVTQTRIFVQKSFQENYSDAQPVAHRENMSYFEKIVNLYQNRWKHTKHTHSVLLCRNKLLKSMGS